MYHMSSQTLHALEEHQRKKFCKICLEDLQENGFPANPDNTEELEQLCAISRQIESLELISEETQYHYFMAYFFFGEQFLHDSSINNIIKELTTDDERNEYLELLVAYNWQEDENGSA